MCPKDANLPSLSLIFESRRGRKKVFNGTVDLLREGLAQRSHYIYEVVRTIWDDFFWISLFRNEEFGEGTESLIRHLENFVPGVMEFHTHLHFARINLNEWMLSTLDAIFLGLA